MEAVGTDELAAEVLSTCTALAAAYGDSTAVYLTAQGACSQLGFDDDTCEQVALYAQQHFANCEQEAENLVSFCPQLGEALGDTAHDCLLVNPCEIDPCHDNADCNQDTSTYDGCMQAVGTDDKAAAALQLCNTYTTAYGNETTAVAETARALCAQLGFGDDTCDDVAQYAAGHFEDCQHEADGLADFCPVLADAFGDHGNGEFACDCKEGYEGDGLTSCDDINACADDPCDALTDCTDLAAPSTGFSCSTCPPGYSGSGEHGCNDEDDCEGNPCGAAGECSNDGEGTGMWQCDCAIGYDSVYDGEDVTDSEPDFFAGAVDGITTASVSDVVDYVIDGDLAVPKDGYSCADAASADSNWGCEDKLIGGYWFGRSYPSGQGPKIALVCRQSCGWIGPICATVDSCEAGTSTCDENADCSHVVVHSGETGGDHSADSYTCTCKTDRGWVGDGQSCEDDNPCLTSGTSCGTDVFGDVSSGSGCCHSLVGGDNGCVDMIAGDGWSADEQFSCLDCPEGYTTGWDVSGQTCTDISDCVDTSTYDACMEAVGTSDKAAAALQLCETYQAAYGDAATAVAETARALCSQLGFGDDTCEFVAQYAADHFEDCQHEADGLADFCPLLQDAMGGDVSSACGDMSTACEEDGEGTGLFSCTCLA
jgi:hypothetical protein